MKRILAVAIVLAVATPVLAQTQSQTSSQPQTKTSEGDATMTESQKGGPASKEPLPNAGGQQSVSKPSTTNAQAAPPAPPTPR
jgi:hypothetical protein